MEGSSIIEEETTGGATPSGEGCKITSVLEDTSPGISSNEVPAGVEVPVEETPEIQQEKEEQVGPSEGVSEVSSEETEKDTEAEEPQPEEENKAEVSLSYTVKPTSNGQRKEDTGEEATSGAGMVPPKQGKEKDLGDVKRGTRKEGERPPKTQDKNKKGTRKSSRIESPRVEIDLGTAKVYLIIPKQELETNISDNIPQQLQYELILNGEKQIVSTKNNCEKLSKIEAEELRVELEAPLKSLKVIYPEELKGKTYSYQHRNEALYAFIPMGSNCYIMHYLYDKHGKLNPLPEKEVCVLLDEEFDIINPTPERSDVRWIWDKYQLRCVNLSSSKELIIIHKQTKKEERIFCKLPFRIEGDDLFEDDLKDEEPLFTGENIKIKAPRSNSTGWKVIIKNKYTNYKTVSKNWTGDNPLELKVPYDLPCECGEFRIDIYERGDDFPIETLFFRYIPFLHIEYPRELIIPEPGKGHKQEIVKILFKKDFRNWELKHNNESIRCKNLENGYQIEMPPQQDTFRFSLMQRGKPETETNIQITIPRLKWRTSKEGKWSDRTIKIERRELTTGRDLYLTVCPNEYNTKYKIFAVLEKQGQMLQKVNLTPKGLEYTVRLNEFYDTIRQNEEAIGLRLEIFKADDKEPLGKPQILYFSPKFIKMESKRNLPLKATGTRGKRKVYRGVVVSDKMNKTIVVAVTRLVQHPLYPKGIKKTSKFKVHDEFNKAKVDDIVEIMETRPLSKTKRWRLVKILGRKTSNDETLQVPNKLNQ